MKKTLLLVTAFCFGIVAMAQDYVIAAYTNGDMALQTEYEQALVAVIEDMDQVDYVDIYTSSDDWAGAEEFIEDYDAVIIFESPSSSTSGWFGAAGFPTPFLCFEPWTLHKAGWEWYAAENFYGANALSIDYRVASRYTEVIEAFDHPIFTGFGFSQGDEVVFSDGGDDLANSENDGDAYGIDLTAAVTDIADAATPLAHSLLAMDNSDVFGSTVNMWAIDENAKTPNAFIYGQHAADLENRTPEMEKLISNALLWVLGEEIVASNNSISAKNNVRAYMSATDLVVRGVNNIASLSVYNLAGQAVLTVESPANTVNVSGLNNGIYMVSVKDAKGVVSTVKVIK